MSDLFIFGGAILVVLAFIALMAYRPSRHGTNRPPMPASHMDVSAPEPGPARIEWIGERFASKLPEVGSMRGVPLPPPWGPGGSGH